MNSNIPAEIQVQTVKAGWMKRSYQFIAQGDIIAQLEFAKSYSKKAVGTIYGNKFEMRRCGFWKSYIEISSTSDSEYNQRIGLNWRNTIKIIDRNRDSYTFKSTSLWGNKWAWFNRNDRPMIEIKSKQISRKNRGLINVKDPEMKDPLFWIVVSWFLIVCSESDAAIVAAT